MANKKSASVTDRTQELKGKYSKLLHEMSTQSQERKVLDYLIEHGSITQREAAERLNCWRLAGRIHRLRSDNVEIITVLMENQGGGGNHAKYIIS